MLERLHLRGARFDLQPMSFPELRELRIETIAVTDALRTAVARSSLPKLEKLELLDR
jgi:hypothetical protein